MISYIHSFFARIFSPEGPFSRAPIFQKKLAIKLAYDLGIPLYPEWDAKKFETELVDCIGLFILNKKDKLLFLFMRIHSQIEFEYPNTDEDFSRTFLLIERFFGVEGKKVMVLNFMEYIKDEDARVQSLQRARRLAKASVDKTLEFESQEEWDRGKNLGKIVLQKMPDYNFQTEFDLVYTGLHFSYFCDFVFDDEFIQFSVSLEMVKRNAALVKNLGLFE